MGWWKYDLTSVSLSELFLRMEQSLHNALFLDSRRLCKEKDVYLDPTTDFQFQLMKLPLALVATASSLNQSSGIFDAKTDGLLMQQESTNKRATFLPDVFPGKSLSYILPLLKQKAGSPSHWKAFSYKTLSFDVPLPSLWKDSLPWVKEEFTYIVFELGKWVLDNSYLDKGKWYIPFLVNPTTQTIQYTSEEWVRTLSLLEFLEENLSIFCDDIEKWNSIRQGFLDQFLKSAQNSDVHSRIYAQKKNSVRIKPQDLKKLDNSFGLPQFLLRSADVRLPKEHWDHFFEYYLPTSIFSWNWWTQVNRQCCQNEYTEKCLKAIENLWDKYTFPLEEGKEWLKKRGTNELAVVFEGTCALPFSLANQRRAILCLQELGKRRQLLHTPFYPQTNYCRLDLTQHVLHGFQLWIEI